VTPALALAPELTGRQLVMRLGGPHALLSWAIVNGGRWTASEVVWLEVRDGDLRPPVDPVALVRKRLAAASLPDAVALLTSRALSSYVSSECRAGGERARCLATVGLGNLLRAGDPVTEPARVGTINVACQLSFPLGELALIEALAIATEARTAAILEAQLSSRVSGAPATGTGTDCIVIAAPAVSGGAPYAGKHTLAGHLIGAAVHEAVRRGVAGWLRENAPASPATARGTGS
jgi:adenosylcobinamide amidohydrolase